MSLVTSIEDTQTLPVLKAQQMLAVCNKAPSGSDCYALQIAYYTGHAQTPQALFERVRELTTPCAKQCIADLGLHAFGWTREEVVARTQLSAQAIDTLQAWPGEALTCLDSRAKNEKNPRLGD